MMNSVAIAGRLTKDVELRYTPNGKPVCTGTLAVQRNFKNPQTNEYDADFVNFVIWGKVAETVANRTEKGGRFGGTGRIQSRSYDGQDGKRVYITEVVIDQITMIDWAGQNQSGGQGNQNQSSGQSRQNNQNNNQSNQGWRSNDPDPFANDGGQIELSDDDLPF